jgi:hypothetical protein
MFIAQPGPSSKEFIVDRRSVALVAALVVLTPAAAWGQTPPPDEIDRHWGR